MNNPYPYGYETWGEKFSRKIKENPWVPVGCLATTGALIMSAVKMRRGESQSMNYWMRARVGLQGATLVALVAGSMALQARKDKALEQPGAASEVHQDELLAKQREKDEFEGRLKGAEDAHVQEAGLGSRVVKGPVVVKRDVQSGPHLAVSTNSEERPASGTQKSWWKLW